jgi:hypothetical protein
MCTCLWTSRSSRRVVQNTLIAVSCASGSPVRARAPPQPQRIGSLGYPAHACRFNPWHTLCSPCTHSRDQRACGGEDVCEVSAEIRSRPMNVRISETRLSVGICHFPVPSSNAVFCQGYRLPGHRTTSFKVTLYIASHTRSPRGFFVL